MRPLSIALLGSRGVPAAYGGYETLMEELSTRLVQRGHRVTVYCRDHYTPKSLAEFRGVQLIVLPTLRTKHLDTPAHTLLSAFRAAHESYDAGLLVNGANALFIPLFRAAGMPVALHVDGIERRRAKWGWLGRSVYALSERLATRLPDRLITDAEVVRRYYLDQWQVESTVIAYGVEPRPESPGELLQRLDVEPGRYLLYVSRFEPENNPHHVAAAYRHVGGDMPLVMVGGAPYSRSFMRSFQRGADPRIRFPGPIFGSGYRELLSHAVGYIHATEVGGTHPALVEAMGYANPVLVNDTPENREVAGDAAVYFRAAQPATLTSALTDFLAAPDAERRRLSQAAAERARDRYSWDRVVTAYERLFAEMSELPRP